MCGTYFRLAFILSGFLFLSCKKDRDQFPAISGSWELRTVYNGQGGAINYPPGNGNLLKFTSTTYQEYSNGTLEKSGTYQLMKYNSRVMAGVRDRIVYDNDLDAPPVVISLSNDSLMLSIDAYDGPSTLYIKE